MYCNNHNYKMNDKIKQELLIRRLKNRSIEKSIANRKKSRDNTSYGHRPKMNKVNIRKLFNNQNRVFSPEEQRHHALSTKNNSFTGRDNSLVGKIINGKYSRKLASPAFNNIRLNSISPASTANQSHIAKLKERILLRNNVNVSNTSKDKTNDTMNKSPVSISPASTVGKFNWRGIRGHNALSPKSNTDNISINSQVVQIFSSETKKKGVKIIENYEFEEDIADDEFRKDLFENLVKIDYENEVDNKLRENLICKVKKV
jgi:hypothetical protein